MTRYRLDVMAALAVLSLFSANAQAPEARSRERMVAEIERRGIRNEDVLRVMRSTPRHLFLPPGARSMAYDDRPVPIGYAATISQPYIVALMTELLAPEKRHRVLEIGTGSGYQAAILAQLSDTVYSMEIVQELAQSAARTLRQLGHLNVNVRLGDGYRGWAEQAPFDRIMLTAAPPEIPDALIGQLAKGGRLVAPVGKRVQELIVIEKSSDGTIRRKSAGAVIFVPMRPAGSQ